MSKAEERLEALAIAGYVAPRMRSAPETTRKRRIKRVDKEGNVVGETTVEEIQKALLAKRAIEFDVQEGVRPRERVCRKCGIAWDNDKNKVNGNRRYCERCVVVFCRDCKIKLPPTAHCTNTTRCRSCEHASRKGTSRRPRKDPSTCGCGKVIDRRAICCRACAGQRKRQANEARKAVDQ